MECLFKKLMRVWEDPWVPHLPDFIIYDAKPSVSKFDVVEDMKNPLIGAWKQDKIKEVFFFLVSKAILKVPIASRGGQDRFLWYFDRKGCYNVKSGYKFLVNIRSLNLASSSSTRSLLYDSSLWVFMWALNVTPKVKHVLRKLSNHFLTAYTALSFNRILLTG